MDETMYERLGESFFFELIDAFYDAVALDTTLRAMYPEDLTESKRHLALFLIQYWGGPRTYQEERGHPRLRLRHDPFVVDDAARDAWLGAMYHAINEMGDELNDLQRQEMFNYFNMAANQLRNV